MKAPVKIGNAQGFWGDSAGAAERLARQQPDLDYLTLDYLSEVSMSIMAIQREKDPAAGFAKDFVEVVRSLVPLWKRGSKVKLISNAGGLNPLGCAQACHEVLKRLGCAKKIGVVTGDDVLEELLKDPDNPLYANMETHESLNLVRDNLITANAYLGGDSIAKALRQGAEIVITGRVADPSLTTGPCIANFDWSRNDYDGIAGATVAGHLIECGTQVTGGISNRWMEIEDPANIGFPIAEVHEDGSCVVTKPAAASGCVTLETVKEQLLYELGDPSHYISPDGIVSFLALQLRQEDKDRIRIAGAKGLPPPNTLKVSATYRDGFKVEGMLVVVGKDAVKKARRCGEMILQKVKNSGFALAKTRVECLGAGDAVPGVLVQKDDLFECVLRVSALDHRMEGLECLAKELAPAVTSGPPGVTGYTSGRPHIRQVFGYWPAFISSDKIKTNIIFV